MCREGKRGYVREAPERAGTGGEGAVARKFMHIPILCQRTTTTDRPTKRTRRGWDYSKQSDVAPREALTAVKRRHGTLQQDSTLFLTTSGTVTSPIV